MEKPKVRLYVDQPLGPGQAVALGPEAANYLFNVMRLGKGAGVALFNGRDGEWRAEVAEAGKRQGIALCQAQTAPQVMPPDLWLMFAPVKKERTAFIVEKAVELGVARLMPVATRHMNSEPRRSRRSNNAAPPLFRWSRICNRWIGFWPVGPRGGRFTGPMKHWRVAPRCLRHSSRGRRPF